MSILWAAASGRRAKGTAVIFGEGEVEVEVYRTFRGRRLLRAGPMGRVGTEREHALLRRDGPASALILSILATSTAD